MSETPTPRSDAAWQEWIAHGGAERIAHESVKLETELAAALAANQRLEKERDAWRVAFSEASHNAGPAFVAHEELNNLRAQVASMTAERDDLIQHFDIKQGTISDAMKRLDVQNRNTAAERDRLMADVVQYRRALERIRGVYGDVYEVDNIAREALAAESMPQAVFTS